MKQLKLFLLVCAIGVLSGCGESLSAGGASLGGSGASSGGGNTPPIKTDDRQKNDQVQRYRVVVPQAVTDVCHGVERTIQMLDGGTLELLASGSEHFLQPMLTNTVLQIRIRNTNPQPVYEYSPDCEVPVSIQDDQQQKIPSDQPLHCTGSASIQVYKPYESRNYQLGFFLPNELRTWQAVYAASYSVGTLKDTAPNNDCQSLALTLRVDTTNGPVDGGLGTDNDNITPDSSATDESGKGENSTAVGVREAGSKAPVK